MPNICTLAVYQDLENTSREYINKLISKTYCIRNMNDRY